MSKNCIDGTICHDYTCVEGGACQRFTCRSCGTVFASAGALVARDFAVIDATLEAACQVLRGGVLVDASNSNWPRLAKALAEHDAALTTEVRDKLVGSICLALHGTLALDGEVGDKLAKSINEHDAALVAEVFADVNSILLGGEIKMRPIPVEQLQAIARKVKENTGALVAERDARIAALAEELQAAIEANNAFKAEIARLRERVVALERENIINDVKVLMQARREGAAEALERAAATAAFANTFSPWRLVVPWSDLLDEAAKLREPRKEGGDA